MPTETLLSQLRRIIESIRASGRRPLRIHLTYGQLQAIKNELISTYKYNAIDAHKMELLGIPLQISEPGAGLWVSCISEAEK
jgi:hypothetical protein